MNTVVFTRWSYVIWQIFHKGSYFHLKGETSYIQNNTLSTILDVSYPWILSKHFLGVSTFSIPIASSANEVFEELPSELDKTQFHVQMHTYLVNTKSSWIQVLLPSIWTEGPPQQYQVHREFVKVKWHCGSQRVLWPEPYTHANNLLKLHLNFLIMGSWLLCSRYFSFKGYPLEFGGQIYTKDFMCQNFFNGYDKKQNT